MWFVDCSCMEMRLVHGQLLFAEMTERKRAMFLTQVEIWWSVGVKVPEGVRPSPANTGQLRMNVLAVDAQT